MAPEKLMLKIRMVEREIARRYPEGKMRTPVHLSIGQEAAAVAVCKLLSPHDQAVSTHRSHAHYLAMGGDLNAFIAELHGKGTGCSGGFGGSMHLVDRSVGFMGSTSIVGGTIPIGVGLAFAKALRGEQGVVVIFHGDAAIEEGVWHESVNFAVLKKLKVLFVCENNGYSCYTPLSERQPRKSMGKICLGHGVRYIQARYNSLKSIGQAAAIAYQMTESGPAMVEIKTQRWFEHCGVKEEIHGIDEVSGLDGSEFVDEINEAFRLAEAAPWPEPRSMYAD